MNDNIAEIINKATKFLGIREGFRVQLFHNAVIDKSHEGVYIIFEGSIIGKGPVIYVGQGKIATRIANHKRKARKDLAPPKYVPEGWKWLVEHKEYDIKKWDICYIPLKTKVDMTALEGVLIKQLEPIANDETFHDRTVI
jgi:hypothetical protein|tara:strand:+ start:1127 stop:1546 length:420 start_codon:yes stop_codon:yes gene_type:complete